MLKKIRITILIIAFLDGVLKYLISHGLIQVNYTFNYGFFLNLFSNNSDTLKLSAIIIIAGYINLTLYFLYKYSKQLELDLISTSILGIGFGINGNIIEKIIRNKVLDYIPIHHFKITVNLSDIIIIVSFCGLLIGSVLYFKKLILNKDNRLPFALNTKYQKDLFKKVFLISTLVSLSLFFGSLPLLTNSTTISVTSIHIVLISCHILNSLILSLIVIEHSQRSSGVFKALIRSINSADSLKDLNINLRKDDYHKDDVQIIIDSLKKFHD